MPIYEYEPTGDQHCKYCRGGFDRLQRLNEPRLENCPECGAPVTRKISAPNLGNAGPSLSESNIEKHGFTQYRKVEKGVYEKTTGKGPDFISKD
jgi:putative FmdB family regulatory protein